MPLRCLFVDMNSYFASVEQQDDPRLRGRPVAVAAVDVPTTACIAASYEAKALGITTGTPLVLARQICPRLVVREARPARYVEVHHRIVAAVDRHLPVEKVESIDEMWGRLAPPDRDRPTALRLAQAVKRSICDEVGEHLRCSIGLAPNRFLAKVATDLQKPDGLVVLEQPDLPDALFRLELQDLPGIASGMMRRLRRYGIDSVDELCRADQQLLYDVWGGIVGVRWWHWLRGHEVDLPPTRRSSVGHSHVLSPRDRTPERSRAVFVRLIHKVAARLRYLGYGARRVGFYVSYTWREEGWSVEIPLCLTQSTGAILREFQDIWPRRPAGVPTQLAVTLYKLEPWVGATPTLGAEAARSARIDRVIDAANGRFGKTTLYFAGMMGAEDSAPTRISFTHIPVLDRAYEG